MKRRRVNPLLVLGVIIFCIFFAVNIISIQIKINQTKESNMQLQAEKAKQEEKNQELKDTIKAGVNNKQYIMDTARDKLGYGEKDEKVYINTGE